MTNGCTLLTRLALTGALLAGPALAQGQIYVVDEANGPGTNFLDLPPAVLAANPGDILVVRAGRYSAIVVDEGISILGEPGAEMGSASPLTNVAMRVQNLPAAQSFTCSGLNFGVGTAFSRFRVEVVNCLGSVHLEGLQLDSGMAGWGQNDNNPALRIDNSPLVHVTASNVTGAPGILAINSNLVVTDSELSGSMGFAGHGEAPSGNGVSATSSDIVLSHCRVEGGSFPHFAPIAVEIGTALKSYGSNWTIRGDGTDIINAGDPRTGLPLDAVMGTGTVVIHPSIIVLGFNGGQAFSPGLQVTQEQIPAMSATGAPLGGTVQLELFGIANQAYALMVGLPGPPIPLGSIGDLYMNPSLGPIFFQTGAIPINRHATATAPVPNDPLLLASRFTWQGLVFDPSTGLVLSNPATYVHTH